jgi:exodeoxyribonuclease-3
MKIISWNVNSIRARIDHFRSVAKEYNPDIFLLQETRVEDSIFPADYLEDLGYNIAIKGQKGRNGVAIFSKHLLEDVKSDFCEEARYIEAFTGGIYVASIYVPNGQFIDSEQYRYKLDFLNDLVDRFLVFHDEIFVAGGDFNVTPYPSDSYDIKNEGLLCSPRERNAIRQIREAGFKDALEDKGFTWWDYRHVAFKKNLGLRIDQFYLSPGAQNAFVDGDVLRDVRALPRPSDHAPIICEINNK